jgi:hypothetical protein
MTSFAASFRSVAEQIDLVIPRARRRRHGVWFFIRDEERGFFANFFVEDVAERPTAAECGHVTGLFAEAVARMGAVGASLIMVLTRPGPTSVGAREGPWFRAAHQACARHGVRLAGVFLAGPAEAKEVFLDDVL